MPCRSCSPSPVPCRYRCATLGDKLHKLAEFDVEQIAAVETLVDIALELCWRENYGERNAPKAPDPRTFVPRVRPTKPKMLHL